MSKQEIDNYLADLEQTKRATLGKLWETILEIIPDAEQCIYYDVPAFRLHGKGIAGFAAFKNHLSYVPFSGSVFPHLQKELAGYKFSSGVLQFPIDKPLAPALIKKLIKIRIDEVLAGK